MKTLTLAIIYAAITTQADGCNIIKWLTGREWPEVPPGTQRFLVIAGIWGLVILALIARYLLTSPNSSKSHGTQSER